MASEKVVVGGLEFAVSRSLAYLTVILEGAFPRRQFKLDGPLECDIVRGDEPGVVAVLVHPPAWPPGSEIALRLIQYEGRWIVTQGEVFAPDYFVGVARFVCDSAMQHVFRAELTNRRHIFRPAFIGDPSLKSPIQRKMEKASPAAEEAPPPVRPSNNGAGFDGSLSGLTELTREASKLVRTLPAGINGRGSRYLRVIDGQIVRLAGVQQVIRKKIGAR